MFGRKMNSPISPETDNFEVESDKISSTADHDRVQARFTACSSCHHIDAVIRNRNDCSKQRKFQRFFA